MFSFIKKVVGFVLVVVLAILLPSEGIKKNEIFLRKTYFDEILVRKFNFEKFTKNKTSINMITGSSHAKDFFDPGVFGASWYNNSNGGQYLPLSIIQLEDIYKNKLKIDTLIITIDDFDLSELKGEVLYNYYLYKKIFVEPSYEFNFKHSFYDYYWDTFKFDIKLLKSFIKRMMFSNLHLTSINSNGFLPKPEAQFYDPRVEIEYGPLNRVDYFKKFLEIAKKNDTHVIIVITPKSKQYFDKRKVEELSEWEEFKRVLIETHNEDFILVNYERQYQDKKYYVDLDHPNAKLRFLISTNLKKLLKKFQNNGF